MNLTIGEMRGNVDLTENEPFASTHTGRTLRSGTVRIRVDRKHEAMMAALPGQVLESDDGRWLVVRRPSHWYQDGSHVAEHTFEIEEFENRVASMLRIADLELKPEKYREDSSRQDGLEVTARVALTDPKQIERLREILASEEPVPVIREGVHDAPRKMAVSILGWSERDREHVFELQCKDPEARKPSGLIGWHSAFARPAHVAFLLEWLAGMSNLLIEKGVASKDELNSVEEKAKKNVEQRLVEFAQVDDVRSHPFKGEADD